MCLISRHIHILLPFLVPGVAGRFGPDGGLFGYLTALDAETLVAVVTGVTGADDMLLLQADYRNFWLNICLHKSPLPSSP